MGFIDLTKSYDSVHRELLWMAFARFGVPEKVLTIFYKFHDMRARVRIDDGEHSGWFNVTGAAARTCVVTARVQCLLRCCDTHGAGTLQCGPRRFEGLGPPLRGLGGGRGEG